MRVYGDRPRCEAPGSILRTLRQALNALAATPAGIERHAALVSILIAAGGLAQGVADAEFAARGTDARSPAQDAAMRLLIDLAQAVIGSWTSGFHSPPALALGHLAQLAALELPARITVKRPEGYAFYALYPEAYALAADALAPGPETQVVGLRSIGTSLAAMVAARLGASTPISLRPIGEPFRRELRLDPELEETWRSVRRFAVVDEGPGLSGSSFGAVADRLQQQGVPASQIAFFPSHPGELGPEASPAHQTRWTWADRHFVSFDDLVLHASHPAHRLESWVADLTGEATAPLEDLSGGVWRAQLYSGEPDWPPTHSFQEARKFRLRTARGSWRLKFVGLDAEADRKLARGQALACAGFTPEVVGLRHGFLVERALDDAKPLDSALSSRGRLVEGVTAYLRYRARAFPAEADRGASLAELLEMAEINAGEALGTRAARRLRSWATRLDELEQRVRRVETDNRMHAWEWLVLPDGRLLKTDAVDHAHAHDLIGCQDIGWDVAGAAVELGLTHARAESLRQEVDVDPELLAFLTPCYLAFQLGAYAVAADAHGNWPAERARLAARRDHYTTLLADQDL